MRSADGRQRRDGDAGRRQSGDQENTGGKVFQTGTGCRAGREEEEESVPNMVSLKEVQLERLWSVLRSQNAGKRRRRSRWRRISSCWLPDRL